MRPNLLKPACIPYVASAFLIAGCTRRPLQPSASSTPPPSPVAAVISASAPGGSVTTAPARALTPTRSPESVVQPEPAAEAEELAAEYQREPGDTRRIEIVYQLAINSSPQARQALERIYRLASDPDTKRQVIEAQRFIESPNPTPSLVLLTDALAPRQPEELRAAAIESLREFESPTALALWQTLVQDADPDIRATAAQMVEYLATNAREDPR